jgi:hypothetical protein
LECGGGELWARITPRFLKLFQNVSHGGQTELVVGVLFCAQALEQFGVAHHRFHVALNIAQNFFNERIRFGVNRRRIQWIVAIRNAQKACRLLEGFVTKARHFLQRLAGWKRAVTVAMVHDVGRD